jgi:hypothetical protein
MPGLITNLQRAPTPSGQQETASGASHAPGSGYFARVLLTVGRFVVLLGLREDVTTYRAPIGKAVRNGDPPHLTRRSGVLPPRAQRRLQLKAEMVCLFALHKGKYGSPRIAADLWMRAGG